MLIEAKRNLVFRINDESENRGIGTHCSRQGIYDECSSETLATRLLVNGKAADQACRKSSISWQSARPIRRQLTKRKTGGSKGIIARDTFRRVESDKAVAHPPPDILRGQFSKIAVEGGNAAGERGSVARRI